ncbi:hypothetical protein H2198_007629 [Neophaeococcomyces mojaviensis]|uniref:Uncharacterized protein n=1 Tax=Neophaeococcomyces mojaviensis TaxID=3383035 RepID=A0ACC2ZZH0_9EURO|nr:hypothetical protein H2198_007629 [Knufia sp. JES_112]
MVLGILSLAATVPLLATSTVQLQNTAQETRDGNGSTISSTKTNKCHIKVVPSARMSTDVKSTVKDRRLILKDGLVKLSAQNDEKPPHHKVTAYFLPFPNTTYDGLVTTIDDMNMLNWVYISKDTYQVTYGTRAVAEQHLTGPMGLTLMADGDSRIIMEGWDGFMAVEDGDGEWSLYFDKDSDGLADKIDQSRSKRIAQIELHREMLE